MPRLPKIIDGEECWQCATCHQYLSRNKFYGETMPSSWCIECTVIYQRQRAEMEREEPNPAISPLEKMRQIARATGRQLSDCIAEAVSGWVEKHTIAAAFVAILLLTTACRADVLTLAFNGQPVSFSLTHPLTSNPLNTIVQSADSNGITFGSFFPDADNPHDPGGHGWKEYPFIPVTAPAHQPWSLDAWTSNPATLRIDVTGLTDPYTAPAGVWLTNDGLPDGIPGQWAQIGTVSPDSYPTVLAMMASKTGNALELFNIPLDSGDPWIVTGLQVESSQELDGPIPLFDSQIIATPEPATLAMFLPLIFARKR